MKKLFFCTLALLTLLVACDPTNPTDDPQNNIVTIHYQGSTVDIQNPLADKGVEITANGACVTIFSTSTIENIEYVISGNSSNGNLKIYSNLKLWLTLNNIELTSTNGPAINIQSKKNISVILAEGSTNTLTDSNIYNTDTIEDARGTLFSEGQLVFSGEGSLTVNGHYKHAIASDDYIEVNSGNITVICDSSDGFHTNDYFLCNGGNLNITCTGLGGDGIDCGKGYIEINNGNLTLKTIDKGIVTSLDTIAEPELVGLGLQPQITINGGTIDISTSGERAHAIDAITDINIVNGNITILATGYKSDGLNCSRTLILTGGSISITAEDDCYKSTYFEGNIGLIQCH